MTTPVPLTHADRGVLIHAALTMLRDAALNNVPSAQEALVLETHYRDAVEMLTTVTGARLTMPTVVNTVTTDTQSVVLAQVARRMQQFLTHQFKTTDWKAEVMRPNKQLKNAVDYQVYDHLASVTQKGDTYFFCVNSKGRYVFSDQKYWTEPPPKVG